MAVKAKNSIFPRNGATADLSSPGADDTASATCEPKYYKSQCGAMLDPEAMNSIMSELLNVVNKNCDGTDSGIDWDCSEWDNLRKAICRISSESLYGCFPDPLPDVGASCDQISSLSLAYNGECYYLATVEPSSIPQATGGFWAVRGDKPINTAGYIIPGDFPIPNLYYTPQDYRSDGGTDPNDSSGINDATVSNSVMAGLEEPLNNPCQWAYDLTIYAPFQVYDTAQEAYIRRAYLSYRYRVDGGNWIYPRTPGTGQVAQFSGQSAINGQYNVVSALGLPPGMIDFQVFYLADTTDYAEMVLTTYEPSYATPSPRFTLRRRI